MDVFEHPLGLGLAHDRFAAHRFKVIDLAHLPTPGYSVIVSPFFMVLGAFTSGLVFRRNTNPDPDRFRVGVNRKSLFWHSRSDGIAASTPRQDSALSLCR